jgi:hypothetical protein
MRLASYGLTTLLFSVRECKIGQRMHPSNELIEQLLTGALWYKQQGGAILTGKSSRTSATGHRKPFQSRYGVL